MSHAENAPGLDRRKLLVAAGLAPLALSANRVLAQESSGQPLPQGAALPELPGDRMRWAVVGLGSFATAFFVKFIVAIVASLFLGTR